MQIEFKSTPFRERTITNVSFVRLWQSSDTKGDMVDAWERAIARHRKAHAEMDYRYSDPRRTINTRRAYLVSKGVSLKTLHYSPADDPDRDYAGLDDLAQSIL